VSFDLAQFKDLIVRRLQYHSQGGLSLYSEEATTLLLATAAHESGLGTKLKQVRGPALGVFQIEKPTFDWLKEKYRDQFPRLMLATADQLEWDLDLSILVARLRYYVAKPPLPNADDVDGMADYWFKYYNASGVEERKEIFKKAWRRYGIGN